MKKSVSVQILGSGNAFGSDGRFNTCIHVATGTYNFLLDCGASSIVALKKFGVDICSLDAIVLTHLHGDHFAGIPFVELACRIEGSRKKPLTIIGPDGTEAAVTKILTLMFPEFESTTCKFVEYKRGVNHCSPLTIKATPALHSPKTNPHSLRIDLDGFTLAFSGDTQWYDGLVDVADAADLFMCECSSIKKGKAHMSYESLLENHDRIKSKRMILNHLGNEVSALEPFIFEKAFDGQKIIIEKDL